MKNRSSIELDQAVWFFACGQQANTPVYYHSSMSTLECLALCIRYLTCAIRRFLIASVGSLASRCCTRGSTLACSPSLAVPSLDRAFPLFLDRAFLDRTISANFLEGNAPAIPTSGKPSSESRKPRNLQFQPRPSNLSSSSPPRLPHHPLSSTGPFQYRSHLLLVSLIRGTCVDRLQVLVITSYCDTASEARGTQGPACAFGFWGVSELPSSQKRRSRCRVVVVAGYRLSSATRLLDHVIYLHARLALQVDPTYLI